MADYAYHNKNCTDNYNKKIIGIIIKTYLQVLFACYTKWRWIWNLIR